MDVKKVEEIFRVKRYITLPNKSTVEVSDFAQQFKDMDEDYSYAAFLQADNGKKGIKSFLKRVKKKEYSIN